MSKQTELAWAAGFFDGEGCTSIATNRNYAFHHKYPRLGLTQKHPEVLERFKQAVSGVNKIHKVNNREEYRYITQSYPEVKRILNLLWPYLSTLKKEQAKQVFSESTYTNSRNQYDPGEVIFHEIGV